MTSSVATETKHESNERPAKTSHLKATTTATHLPLRQSTSRNHNDKAPSPMRSYTTFPAFTTDPTTTTLAPRPQSPSSPRAPHSHASSGTQTSSKSNSRISFVPPPSPTPPFFSPSFASTPTFAPASLHDRSTASSSSATSATNTPLYPFPSASSTTLSSSGSAGFPRAGELPSTSRGTSKSRRETQMQQQQNQHRERERTRSFGPVQNPNLSAPKITGVTSGRGVNSATETRRATSPVSPEGDGPNTLDAKVVILGSQAVGKTSIVHRYIAGQFSYANTSTIGASFLVKKITLEGCKVRLQIWDTAGQERFRSMAPLYYRGALAAIIVYDITDLESFNDLQTWLQELRENMSSDLIIHVVGSKADLADQRVIDLPTAQRTLAVWDDAILAKQSGAPQGRSRSLSPLSYVPPTSPTPPFPATSDPIIPPLTPTGIPRPRARTLSTRRSPAPPSITTTSATPASVNVPLHISASSSSSNVSGSTTSGSGQGAGGIQPLTLGGIAAAAVGIPTMFGTRVRTLSTTPSLSPASGAQTGSGSGGSGSVSASSSEFGGELTGMTRSGSKLSLGPLSAGGRGSSRRSFEDERRNANGTSSTNASGASGAQGGGGVQIMDAQQEEDELERIRVDQLVEMCEIQISEVSAKEDWGIEDVFLDITQKLVARKAQIESQRVLRSRDSVMLSDVANGQSNSENGWCAC